MATSRHHAQRAVLAIVATLLGLAFFAPMVALADDTLSAGQTATVTTGGGGASLRSGPSFEAEVTGTVADGASASILEGPLTGADGSLWYVASIDGLTGYISTDLVSGDTPPAPSDTTTTETPEPEATDVPETSETDLSATEPAETETEPAEDAAPSIPWAEPVDFAVVVDNSADPLPGDGLACRADASTEAEVLARLAPGAALEVTGDEIWAEGIAFTPINCAGVGGFVRSDYVLLDSEAAVEEEAEAVTEQPVTEQPVTEEPVTEEPVTDVPVTEVATEEPVAEEATEAAAVEETAAPATEESEVTEEPVTEESEATEAAATEEPVTVEPEATDAATEEAVATEELAVEAEGTVDAEPEDATTEDTGDEGALDDEATPTATEAASTVIAETPADAEVAATETADAPDATVDTAAETEAPTAESGTNQVPANEAAGRSRTTQPATVTPTPAATQTPTEEPDATTPTETAETASETSVAATPTATATERAAPAQVDPSLAIGTAEVVDTNGDGVRCRTSASADASTITVLAEGTTVQVLSVERNGYLGVICGGQAGFADVTYLWSGGAGDEIAANAGSVTVVGTGGGLNCRTGAGTSYGVITVLREGTTVSIRGASSNGWAPVVCGGQNGYVSIDYVEAAGSASSGGDGSVSAAATTMVVSGTNGDGVRCRSQASTTGSIITVLGEGTRVSARGSASGGWVPVTCAGRSGYVSATYLRASSGSTSGGTTGGGPTAGSNWSWVKVTGTGGGGVRCRSSASLSGAIIMVVGEGSGMAVRGSASNGWLPVNCGGRSGFVSSQYVTSYSRTSPTAPSPTPTPTPTPPSSTSGMVNGDHAKVTARLNLRYSPSLGAGISTTIPDGTVILVTGRATSGFYPVNWDGLRGYVSQDYVYETTAALSKRGGSAPTSPTAPPTNDGGSNATGNSMSSFALRYEGYPYIWATSGPSSFDCSGFTYWVTKNVTGKDIGTGLWTQVSAGTPVSRANLQPGDLVFFQNTYKAGLSHSGVYIGNNRFIHAENETTGVRISDLNSTYYSSRWYGAVRMT